LLEEASLWSSGSVVRLIVLASGVLALLALPLALVRRSPASALWVTVVLTPLGLVNLLGIALLRAEVAFMPGSADCVKFSHSFDLMLVNAIALLCLAVASLRSERRGIDPDRSPEPIELSLDETRPVE
jgi:hypothetical protein